VAGLGEVPLYSWLCGIPRRLCQVIQFHHHYRFLYVMCLVLFNVFHLLPLKQFDNSNDIRTIHNTDQRILSGKMCFVGCHTIIQPKMEQILIELQIPPITLHRTDPCEHSNEPWLAEWLLASQEGLCYTEWVITLHSPYWARWLHDFIHAWKHS
jgi:hypothetical protein